MAESDQLYFRADDELRDQVERFQARFGFEDRSKATRRLVEIGLRESKAPLLYRLKDRGADAAFYLAIAAMTVIAIGHTTSLLSTVQSVQAATVLVAMGVGILGLVELLRALNGQSEVGEFVREVRQ